MPNVPPEENGSVTVGDGDTSLKMRFKTNKMKQISHWPMAKLSKFLGPLSVKERMKYKRTIVVYMPIFPGFYVLSETRDLLSPCEISP